VELGADISAVVADLLYAFVDRLRARDIQGVISLFDHEAVLFGSEAAENATGQAELQLFFRRIFERPQTYGWQWDSLRVSGTNDVVWFVGPATVVVRGDDGTERSAPYRLSGVLKRQSDGGWLFVLFNGAEPVGGPEYPSADLPV
jgi:ketosteroid isomerase-like protein